MPRIDYIAHSCVKVTTSDTTLLFDPWLFGPCYKGQWHLFPKPIGAEDVLNAEHILLTHGHEDHMHRQTLERMDKRATVWFPYQWRQGIAGYMRHVGFQHVKEAVTLRKHRLGPNTRITYLAYSLESIVVVEADGLVIVNINDALNSNHENVVMMFLRQLKERWPRIDILISGFSGAGYFPNQVRYPGKDDREIGLVREHYFAHNLCRYAHYLKPRLVMPFAPGFALLERHNRWVNEVKFDRARLHAYHEEHIGPLDDMRYLVAWPGDRIDGLEHQPLSPYHDQVKDGGLYHLLNATYPEEIKLANTVAAFDRTRLPELKEAALTWMAHNTKLYAEDVLREARFAIRFVDVPGLAWNIDREEGAFRIQEAAEPLPDRRVVIDTRAAMLEHSLNRVWGGDALTAGYALVVRMFDLDALEKNLDIVCVRLITRYPIMREDILRQPLRAAKYFLTNPAIAALHMKQKIKLRPYVNRYPYNERDHWIATTKCELCQVCRIPVIDYPQAVA
ncbi:MAG: MBL fold metallo-hydrolase [Flavobacteriales bacterium]|nr:MBL fold metallo-hydrolase [Flavobacteriales bacterium]